MLNTMSLLAAVAAAQLAPAASGGEVPVIPIWAKRPTAQDMANGFPSAALKKRVGGDGRLACRVSEKLRLQDCSLIKEFPLGLGFGEATLALAAKFVANPISPDGTPIAGRLVEIPVQWVLMNPPAWANLSPPANSLLTGPMTALPVGPAGLDVLLGEPMAKGGRFADLWVMTILSKPSPVTTEDGKERVIAQAFTHLAFQCDASDIYSDLGSYGFDAQGQAVGPTRGAGQRMIGPSTTPDLLKRMICNGESPPGVQRVNGYAEARGLARRLFGPTTP